MAENDPIEALNNPALDALYQSLSNQHNSEFKELADILNQVTCKESPSILKLNYGPIARPKKAKEANTPKTMRAKTIKTTPRETFSPNSTSK